MLAQPMRRQCFSIRLDSATFSPISVHAGEVRDRRAASALTATTLAPVAVDPMLTICAYVSLVLSTHGFKTYQDFVLCKLRYLGLLAICSLDTEQSSKQEVVDLELSVDVREMSAETQDETDETIRATQGRVYAGTDTCNVLVENE